MCYVSQVKAIRKEWYEQTFGEKIAYNNSESQNIYSSELFGYASITNVANFWLLFITVKQLYIPMYVQYGGKWMEQASQVWSLTNQDMSAHK
jgi:hypothetical protein